MKHSNRLAKSLTSFVRIDQISVLLIDLFLTVCVLFLTFQYPSFDLDSLFEADSKFELTRS